MYDVVIIGAGPSGTAAAFDLLTAGASVLILDKTAFPRKKACAGGITPKGILLYRYDISAVIKRKCRTVKVRKKDGGSFLLQDKKTLCYMTCRKDLDAFSLNHVISLGGRFNIARKIKRINEKDGGVEICTDIGTFKASYLIGADGANSRVRRLCTGQACFRYQLALEADVPVDRPELYGMEFDFSNVSKGYQWIFPKDDHVNIGIYSLGTAAKLNLEILRSYARKRLGDGGLKNIKGYPICTGGYHYHTDSGRVLLVGDAAGLAEPLLGEGIFFALKSGQLAAGAILSALQGGYPAAANIYQKRLVRIRRDLKIHGLAAALFYRFPRLSLNLLSFPRIHERFVRGYAGGRSVSRILTGR